MLLTIAACADNSAFSLNAVPGAAQAPGVPVLSDACGVVDQFLKAWETTPAPDYPTMYSLLSSRSLATSQAQFTTIYQHIEEVLTGNKGASATKTHTINCDNAVLQGTTAAVPYTMTFSSPLIGQFSDKGRTMRLVWTARGWRVAWSQLDIFDGMAGGATLNLEYTTAVRGSIYDRNGKPFAQDGQTLYTVKLLTDSYPKKPDDCFNEISSLFRRKFADVQTQYKGLTGLQYGEIIGTLDTDAYNAHHAELDSVCKVTYTSRSNTRVYYDGGLGAQTIGYVSPIPGDQLASYPGYPPSALIGRDGIERKFENQLKGTAGVALTIRLSDNTLIRTLTQQTGGPGGDVTLTLDRDLQDATEHAINDAYSYAAPSWAQFSTGAAAVVIDVRTGQILAMASYPTFDVDVFNPDTSLPAGAILPKINAQPTFGRSTVTNLATQEYSALGSVFKIPSMAAALDTGTFRADSTYNCTGVWNGAQFGDSLKQRYDWIALDPGYKNVGNKHGLITLVQALTSSCDAYFWQVGGTLNKNDAGLLAKYAGQLGLGQSTGLADLPLPDLPGQLPSPANIGAIEGRPWGVGDGLNTVIGQGDVKVTVLQVAHMMSAVANGGTLYRPYLVSKVTSSDGKVSYTATPQTQGTIGLKAGDIRSIQDGLCGATQDKVLGTAQWFMWNWNFKQINVCGKTGTAQTGTLHPNGWFAAYAGRAGEPPEIAIAVLVEHGREGSETAGPIVRRIIEAYYHIPFNDWPPFWSQPYQPMANPDQVSDGGRHNLATGQ
ncbi:MAG: penicillin-binding transpeptidase domain-containing protein [Aggregatilineales bacterium]